MENVSQSFGKKLRLLRKLKGYTQGQLADILNTTRSCISNYELGNRQPDNETVSAMADFFDVSIDYLMGRSPVSLPIKTNEHLLDLQKISTIANNTKEVDLNRFSAKEICMILKFYEYLVKKDTRNKIDKHKIVW